MKKATLDQLRKQIDTLSKEDQRKIVGGTQAIDSVMPGRGEYVVQGGLSRMRVD